MRKRVTVVTLSVCHSVYHFFILEKAPFSGVETYISTLCFKCSTFLKIEAISEAELRA